MRSTLFHIPPAIELGGFSIPLFGVGLLLATWAMVGAAAFVWMAARHGLLPAVRSLGVSLAVVAGLILLIPMIDDGQGLPIRGYGVMLLIAAMAGTWLSIVRGRRMGFDADTILSLATEVFLWGLVGARLFYVIEYHDQFFGGGRTVLQSLVAVANITGGGLVVFGSLPTAALAAWRFAHRRHLSLARLADCAAPGMLLGLAIGRVGCFLNGCCFGGPCDLPWAMQFPDGTAPASQYPGPSGASLPLHPTQLYAAIDAAILSLLAVTFTPLARRDGEVFTLVLTLHPISRMLLEMIRVDEPSALGTPFSISQLVSLALLALAAGSWWWLSGQPVREARDRL